MFTVNWTNVAASTSLIIANENQLELFNTPLTVARGLPSQKRGAALIEAAENRGKPDFTRLSTVPSLYAYVIIIVRAIFEPIIRTNSSRLNLDREGIIIVCRAFVRNFLGCIRGWTGRAKAFGDRQVTILACPILYKLRALGRWA